MRFPAAILIAASVLAAGCTSLTGRTRDRDRDDRPAVRERDRDRDRDDRWWLSDGAGRDAGGGAGSGGRGRGRGADLAKSDREGIIAGELVDGSEGRRLKGKTYIVIRPADEVAPASERRNVGVETDDDGYFFVPGLIPGKTYILSVVREIDGRKIAGEAQVRPPAGNVRMELTEGKVSSVTPPLPPAPGMGPFEKSDPSATRAPVPADPPETVPPPGLRKEFIAGNPTLPPTAAIRPPPPAAVIAPPAATPPADPLAAPPPPPPTPDADPPTARGTSQRVPNFALCDVLQADWDLRSARGRLVLVEFWGTTCLPCARAVPALNRLHADYGASGLELVAVACDPEGPLASRARLAEEVSRKKGMTYKVYVEREGRVGEVQQLFDIRYVPSLVLLDRQGAVLWRGGATDTDLARAEEVIKAYLTRR